MELAVIRIDTTRSHPSTLCPEVADLPDSTPGERFGVRAPGAMLNVRERRRTPRTGSASSARTRRSISSRIGRMSSRVRPAGSSRTHPRSGSRARRRTASAGGVAGRYRAQHRLRAHVRSPDRSRSSRTLRGRPTARRTADLGSGVHTSTGAGATWTSTGTVPGGRPQAVMATTDEMMAATTGGLHRTTDGATTSSTVG